MLATDRQLLLTQLKQNTTSLKQKEFNLHHSNLMTVGTQAAVLAGLDVVMFIEFAPPPDSAWADDMQWVPRCLKFMYYTVIISAFCCNMIVVAHTTSLSVLAGSLALRGPDGSMLVATDGLYQERKHVYPVFGVGLALTVGSCVLGVWIILEWEAALLAMMVAIVTCCILFRKYRSFSKRFEFDHRDTVDFKDILLEGPAAIQGVPHPKRRGRGLLNGVSKKFHDKKHVASHHHDAKKWIHGSHDEEHVELMETGKVRRRPASPRRRQQEELMWK